MSRRWKSLALVVGLGIAIGLALFYGVEDILHLLLTIGWGLLLIAALQVVPLLLHALAWRTLLTALDEHPPLLLLTRLRWLAYAVNALLPVAQVGGEVVRVRKLAAAGVRGPVAAGSVVVDMTADLLSLVIFVFLSFLALLMTRDGSVLLLATGAVILGAMLVAFLWTQRSGLLPRVAGRFANGREGWVREFQETVRVLYAERQALVRCTGWKILAWLSTVAQIWVALLLLGQGRGPLNALIVEGVGQAARNVGFFMAASLGVQEGGYVLGAELVGLSPQVGFTLALVRRVRDLVMGVPALLAWQIAAGQRARTAEPAEVG